MKTNMKFRFFLWYDPSMAKVTLGVDSPSSNISIVYHFVLNLKNCLSVTLSKRQNFFYQLENKLIDVESQRISQTIYAGLSMAPGFL